MRHIILAAGMGTRLFPTTLDLPKVLLKVGGTTLLSNQVDISLRFTIITQITVVTGYLAEQINEYIAKLQSNNRVNTVYNEHFTINNPIYSLYVAMPVAYDEDFMITNGDVYYGQSLMRHFIETSETGITMAISPYRDHSGRAMTVHVSQGRMVAIYPHAPERDAYESPGIVVVKGEEARNVFYHSMARLYKRYLGQPHYWHDILNEAKLEFPIQVQMIGEEAWGEVDTESDLAQVNEARARIDAN